MKKSLSLLALVLLLCLTAGCLQTKEQAKEEITFFAMDTVMRFTAYGPHAAEGLAAAEQEIYRLERIFSPTMEHSDVARINGSAGRLVEVSEDTRQILRLAVEIGQASGGALDVTVRPLSRAWGFADFASGNFAVLTPDEIAELLPLVEYKKIRLEGTSAGVEEGMALDLGAVAKGYAGDRAMEVLREAGVTSAVLSLGGNVQSMGGKPDGSAFVIGIQQPKENGEILATVEQIDGAAVTSGGYQRSFTQDGVSYHHILDPATGYPADSGLLSVTVFCPQGAMADALSTALFVMGEERAMAYWQETGGFEAVLVRQDGSIALTAGLEGKITILKGADGP